MLEKTATNMQNKIISAVEQRRQDLIDLTQDLIRIPTLNPPGTDYETICQYLANRLKAKGFDTEMVRAHGTPGDSDVYPRWNMVARFESALPGPCVHFNSHIDVVEVGEGWTKDPFGGEIEDDKIYGRGACDMKGGLASSIIAAEAFLNIYPNFQGAIEISGTADEESGGYGGVAYLAEKGYFTPERVSHVIIPEPLNKDRICLGHRGVWWAEIETKGRIAHGSMPFLGDSAINHMGSVLEQIEHHLLPLLKGRTTQMPVVPEGARQPTLNINSIHGGEPEQDAEFDGLPAPCVADRCRIIIDRRFLIEEQLDDVKSEMHCMLDGIKNTRPDFEYDIQDLFEVHPSLTPKEAPVVQTVSKAISSILGTPPEYVVSPGTYDQKHIDRIGKLKNCIAYGPGILELAHQPDEWVGIEDMLDSAKVMALSLEDILVPKLEPSEG